MKLGDMMKAENVANNYGDLFHVLLLTSFLLRLRSGRRAARPLHQAIGDRLGKGQKVAAGAEKAGARAVVVPGVAADMKLLLLTSFLLRLRSGRRAARPLHQAGCRTARPLRGPDRLGKGQKVAAGAEKAGARAVVVPGVAADMKLGDLTSFLLRLRSGRRAARPLHQAGCRTARPLRGPT
jgi:hypothetical protein